MKVLDYRDKFTGSVYLKKDYHCRGSRQFLRKNQLYLHEFAK